MDRTHELADLLTSLFSEAELRMFVRSVPGGERLALDLPGTPASLALLAFEAAALLARHGRIDAELFRRLHEARPHRRADIERIALSHRGQDAAGLRVSISRLPISGSHFVGREAALAGLDGAWEDPRTRIFSIVAWGGAGKTALVNRWLQDLEQDGWRGAERVFGWSFYSQGTRDSIASAEPFIDAALRWFGDDGAVGGSARDRGLRLVELIRRQRTLLVLDGIEPLQYPPGADGMEGRLKDTSLAVVLRELAADMQGLCVVTTRLPVAELASRARSSAPQLDLERLSATDGAVLLRMLGVQGSEGELQQAVEDMQGHALALTLLGRYLARARGGDVRHRHELPVLEAAGRLGSDRAYRVMAAYDAWLGERERAVLRLLGLFDRPAEEGAIAALRAAPPIPGLTDGLAKLPADVWQLTLSNLRSAALLAPATPGAPDVLDAHPLVRTYFGDVLRKQHPDAWCAGHQRLYDHYRTHAPEFPDSLEEMLPLILAMTHGCHAGRRQEALDEIYWKRIRRGGSLHSVHRLGAYGADLTALSGLFERPWEKPAAELAEGDQAFVLNEAGYDLRALGRLSEACVPMQASLERGKSREQWKNAAVAGSNLSELFLTLGRLDRALAHAEESVALADRSDSGPARIASRATLADALHQAGRVDESARAFQLAEEIQQQHPFHAQLLSFEGYSYCDLLLAPIDLLDVLALGAPLPAAEETRIWRTCEDVLARAALILERAEQSEWLLDLGLAHLAFGRAHLGLGMMARIVAGRDEEESMSHLATAAWYAERAVDHLRRSGREDHLPRGLLARARIGRWCGYHDGIVADLTEALDIAERGVMRLYECDAHLEWARYCISIDDMDGARVHLSAAGASLALTGYARRQREHDMLRSVLEQPASKRASHWRAEHARVTSAEQTQDMKPEWLAGLDRDAVVEPPRSMAELEGVWIQEGTGARYCVKVVEGELRIGYSLGNFDAIIGECHGCRIEGDFLFARFGWFSGGLAGKVRLRIGSDQQLRGHWWYDPEASTYPYPVELILNRCADDYPQWALDYFASVAARARPPSG